VFHATSTNSLCRVKEFCKEEVPGFVEHYEQCKAKDELKGFDKKNFHV
jgi:hypothetical protein